MRCLPVVSMSEQLNMNIDVCIFEVVRCVRLSSVSNLSLFFLLSLDMQERMHKMFLFSSKGESFAAPLSTFFNDYVSFLIVVFLNVISFFS